MDKKRFLVFSSILFVFALLALTSTVTALTESELCDSGDLSTTCTVSNDATLDDGDTFNGQDLVIDAGLISSGNYTLNFSGNVTFQSNAYLEGGGDIYSDRFENFQNLDLNTGTGNAYLCERNGATSCKPSNGNVALDTEYNITEDRFVFRRIEDDWNRGYLNWTENVSRMVDLDSNFTEIEAYYTVSGLLENKEFKLTEDGSQVNTVESDVNFSEVIWDKFSPLESKNVSVDDTVFLEASSITESKGDGISSASADGFITINLEPLEEKRINTILLYAESSKSFDYYIKDLDTGENIVENSYSHSGGNWEDDPIEEEILKKDKTYEFGINPSDNVFYYDSNKEPPEEINGINWTKADGGTPANYIINAGVGIIDGYKPEGYFTTKTLDAGSEVDWNSSSFNETTPSGTSINYNFGTNESGTWNYYGSISNLPDSRYVRVNTSLSTTDSSVTPGVDVIEGIYNPPGRNGLINFNEILSQEHRIELGETTAPSITNQAQSNDLISVDDSNTLSVDVKDNSSGIEKVILQTNETGISENKSDYTKNFDQSLVEESVDLTWKNDSFSSLATIEWKIWARDGAGNWESSGTKSFEVDGAPPDISNLNFQNTLDIDNEPAAVSAEVTDEETSVASVEIEENSTGSFVNSSMSYEEAVGQYQYDISASSPSEVDFTIYAEDNSGNIETASGDISFQNISLSPSVSKDPVNNSESFEVSGEASLLPYGSNVTSDIEFWASTGSEWESLGTNTPSSGQFSLSSSLTDSGSYEIKTNTSNSDSIYGEASTFVDVLLNIRDSSTVFEDTGNTHVDVDSSNQDINLSANIEEPQDDSVSSVTASVTDPDGSSTDIDLADRTGRTWYNIADIGAVFGSTLGEYNAIFTADSSNGLGSNVMEKTFSVENITVSSSLGKENVSVGESTEISGDVILRPFDERISSDTIQVSPEGESSKELDVSNGDYSGQIDFSSPGNKTVGLDITDSNGITGTNSTEVHVFNLSAEIIDANGDEGSVVYRDGSPDIDIEFEDNVSAPPENPVALEDITASYTVPDGWQGSVSDIGTLEPGESSSSNPGFDIVNDADLGEKTVDLNVGSSNGITDSGNFTVEVWTYSESDHITLEENGDTTINRNLEDYTVFANVTDNSTGVALEDVETELNVGETDFLNSSNSTGGVRFDINLEQFSTGEYPVRMQTLRTSKAFAGSTEDFSSNPATISIQGVMQKGTQYTIDPVYRTDSSGSTSTLISGVILDSTGAELANASLTAELAGEDLGTAETDSDGTYTFSYSPPKDIQPDKYNTTIIASKDKFEDFTFNRTVDVRGVLNLTNNFDKPTIGRGISHEASALVTDDFDNSVPGNVVWSLNSTEVGEGKDTELNVPSDLSRGYYTLNASTTRNSFDDDWESVGVDVYGQASVDLKPEDFTIRPGNNVTLEATVNDDNRSDGIGNYPVKFNIDDGDSIETIERSTNSSGVATYEWELESGSYDVEASIQDNKSLYYNASDGSDISEVFVGDKMYLDKLSFSENPVNRYPDPPDETRVTAKLTETSDTINRVPVDGETINFEVNGSDTFSCITESDGTCGGDTWYDPTSDVTPGNLDVDATTDRTGWIDVNRTEKLAVRGLMLTSLDNPAEDTNLPRGDTFDLKATTDTFSGGTVERNLTWSLSETDGTNEEVIQQGYDADWTVPDDQPTGAKTLTATGDGEYFDPDSESIDVWVLGKASPAILRPDNDSKIGYADPKTVRCEVTSNEGNEISDYPVEFFDNSSGFRDNFAKKQTESTASGVYAEASWHVPNEITSLEAGCRIETNRTIGYEADIRTSERVFRTKDDKKPVVEDLDVPQRVSPGEDANITFNASDENSIDEISEQVVNPALATVDGVEINELSGNGYEMIVPTEEGLQGDYTVNLDISDPAGNTVERTSGFKAKPGGEISLDIKNLEAENITQTEDLTKLVNVSLFINNSATEVRMNATSDSNILYNGSSEKIKSCGTQGEKEYCNATFEMTIPADTEPTDGNPIYADFRGLWEKEDGSGLASLGDFTEITVDRNPILEETTGDKSIDSFAHDADAINISDAGLSKFGLESTGNYPVENYDTGFYSEGLERDWIKFYRNPFNDLQDGNVEELDVEIDVPEGTPPASYEGIIEFRSSNAKNVNRSLTLGITEDDSYTVESSNDNPSAVRGSTGDLVDLELNSTGNINQELVFSASNEGGSGECAKRLSSDPDSFILERQTSMTASVDYNFTTLPDDQGDCTVDLQFGPLEGGNNRTATVSIDTVNFTLTGSAETGEAIPGDVRDLSFTPEIGGENVTDNIEYDVLVNGTEASIRNEFVDSNGFEVEYVVPEVPDARIHDVEVVARDTSKGVGKNKEFVDAITVPDRTNPEFGEFDVLGVSPGEDLEVNVPVSDNNLAGVSSVSMNVTGPNLSKEVDLTQNGESWSYRLENLSEGLYDLNFTAVDPVGLNATATDTFRVSNGTKFDGSFTGSGGNVIPGRLTISDSNTGRTLSEEIDGTGNYSFNNIRSGDYNIEASFEGQKISMNKAPVDRDNLSLRAERLDGTELSGLTPSNITNERIMGIGVETELQPESSTIQFNYTGEDIPSNYDIEQLQVARCGNYDYDSLRCESSDFELIDIGTFDVNKGRNLITVETDGFSSYTLFAPVRQDEEEEQEEEEDTSSSGGGGGGGLSEDDLNQINDTVSETREEVENLSGKLNDSQTGAELGSSTINAELRPGESMQTSLTVSNTLDKSQTFIFNVDDSIDKYVNVTNSLTLEASDSEDVILSISVPQDELSGSYTGSLSVQSSEINTEIPVNIQVTPPQDKLLDLSVKPVFSTVQPGETLQLEASFSNQGYARNVDVTADFEVIDPDSNETVASIEETVAVGTTLNRIFELQIPEDTELKSYAVRGSARYTNIDVARVATASSSFTVDLPFWSRTFLGFTYGNIGLGFLIFLLTSTAGIGIYNYRRKKALEKKRYMEKIDMSTIPTGGSMQAYLGQLAEIGTRTFMKLDDLTTHALIAGATGSGKTVTGQVMVEEALDKGANVIVLDPTAQWTGYLRENEDPEMKELYEKYGLSKSDARAYDGNIRAVEPGDEIDITPYLEQDEDGQIIIFSLHKLDSKNIDEFANKTIQQIFDANLPERNGLETVIVYDEVHRLLEKFGGNGEGLKQLERGAREFRKWGVGMVLLSQVISDFSGEIRANIGTTVQMRTQYDDDLDRIKNKFGLDTVKSIAKAEVGSGMLQSSDYNHGRPYFIDFRPLLHSPHRLSDEELEKYEDYNKRIDRVEARVNELEEQGEEVYEYRSELKLTKRNLKKGSFTLVDTYIDELEEKLDM